MAGVIAHSRAIVNSANARTLVTLISVLRFLISMNVLTIKNNASPTWMATAVTAITVLKPVVGDHYRPSENLRSCRRTPVLSQRARGMRDATLSSKRMVFL